MGAYMTSEYNSNVCVMCNVKKEDGSIKNDKFICTECINSISPKKPKVTFKTPVASSSKAPPPAPTPTPKPVTAASSSTEVPRYSPNPDGKCTGCNHNYGYCKNSVVVKGKWFCDKTCSQVYTIAANPLPATYGGLFASSLCTVRPLSVSVNGTMVF